MSIPRGTQTIAYAEVLRLESTEEIPDSHRLPDGTDIYFDIYPGGSAGKRGSSGGKSMLCLIFILGLCAGVLVMGIIQGD